MPIRARKKGIRRRRTKFPAKPEKRTTSFRLRNQQQKGCGLLGETQEFLRKLFIHNPRVRQFRFFCNEEKGNETNTEGAGGKGGDIGPLYPTRRSGLLLFRGILKGGAKRRVEKEVKR